jgi:hypothetical protein
VADFETTTDPNDCRVWLWGTCDIDDPDDIVYGIDMDSFIRQISKFDSHIYFHNLKFDGSFVLDWLLNNGYRHETGFLRKGEFSTLISMQGQFYSIKVTWKNGHKTEFRDSFKKLPMSVANVAKAFKLDEAKGVIDYEAYRPVGHEPTEDELEYLINDLVIVAKALSLTFNEGMTRLTVGSDSLAEFKRLTGGKMFANIFPVLPESMDAEIRRAYRGGFTYKARHQPTGIVGRGNVYDVNSLYPSVMYDRPLPYGEPQWFKGAPKPTETHPLFIVSITFTAKLKPGHIPCIQIKANPFFASTIYQEEINEPVTMSCTNVDLALWEDHYDLDILAWEGGWAFNSVTGLFCEFIDKWMEVKANSDGGRRAIAKLFLNSLYGKFATNPNVTPRIPVLENGIVKLEVGPEETRDPVYTPVGVFITAYARDVTIRAAQAHYDTFLYADTDSLHLLASPDDVLGPICDHKKVPDCSGHSPKLNVDPNNLGTWKHETTFEQALYIRPKAYMEKLYNGEYITHISGLDVEKATAYLGRPLTFEDMRDGAQFGGKLSPKRVPGGIVLEDVGFTINHENVSKIL